MSSRHVAHETPVGQELTSWALGPRLPEGRALDVQEQATPCPPLDLKRLQ